MKKTLIILATITLFLASCGSDIPDPNQDKAGKGYIAFESSDITLQYPEEWDAIAQKDFTSEIPEGTLAAFRSPKKDTQFVPNIGILKNDLPREISSLDYAKGLIQKHASNLLNYKEISRREIDISVGDKSFPSLFVVFEGKEKEEAEIKEFVQISAVKKKTAFIATGAYLKTDAESMREAVENAIKSFKVN